MSEAEEIYVDDETIEDKGPGRNWSEAFKVSGDEVLRTVKRVARQAGVRRIVVMDRNQRVLIQIPLLLGASGIALLPFYSALALIAALAAECTITVEGREKSAPAGA
jgi:hypothetical protein